MNRSRTTLLMVASLAFAACSGSDPGVGSKTLFVKAGLASDGSTDGTAISVEVREGSANGDVVTDATVTLKGQQGGDLLIPLIVSSNTARYLRGGFAWEQGFVLSVRRGQADTLDAALELPGITVITEPVAGTTFSKAAQRNLAVRWRDDFGRGAQFAEVRLEKADIRQTLPQDLGFYEIDPARLVMDDRERVTVTRTNKVSLAGGLPGSEWTGTTEHRIEFRVE